MAVCISTDQFNSAWSHNTNKNFISVTDDFLKELKISFDEVVSYCPSITELKNIFHLSNSDVQEALNDLGILPNKLLRFYYSNSKTLPMLKPYKLICENAYYYTAYDKQFKTKRTININVFLIETDYVDLQINQLKAFFFQKQFPKLYNYYTFTTKRFERKYEINPNTKISELEINIKSKLTCQDILDIITKGDEVFKEKIKKSSFVFYDNISYLYMGKLYDSDVITIPYSAIQNKTFDDIDNYVLSIYEPDKRDWKEITQKEQYANNKTYQLFKQRFLKLVK